MEQSSSLLTRGELLKSGVALAALSPLEREQSGLRTRAYNGGTDPFPIPWLDKNGSHNQPAGPNAELSHIYHFKCTIARTSGFVGMGTDNTGNRLPFGSPTTDFGIMTGEYFAARRAQQGSFVHI